MTSILTVDAVQKTYGGPFTLGPINFAIDQGECVGLLGKNGAGKTTLFQLITGCLDATEGQVKIDQARMTPDKHQLKREIGYLPQDLQLPRWVTASELLSYATRLYELKDVKALISEKLKFWDCDWYAHRPLATCSHGMQKRIALALATIHNPKLLILDEPFSGLDLFHIKALQTTVLERRDRGLATIVCTHIAPYAARLCQRVLLLDNGKLSQLEHWTGLDYMQKITAVEDYFFAEESSG